MEPTGDVKSNVDRQHDGEMGIPPRTVRGHAAGGLHRAQPVHTKSDASAEPYLCCNQGQQCGTISCTSCRQGVRQSLLKHQECECAQLVGDSQPSEDCRSRCLRTYLSRQQDPQEIAERPQQECHQCIHFLGCEWHGGRVSVGNDKENIYLFRKEKTIQNYFRKRKKLHHSLFPSFHSFGPSFDTLGACRIPR